MTKLKCWRKIGKITWENPKIKTRVMIPYNPQTKKFDAEVYREGSIKYLTNYSTKSKALLGANKYMKSHDKC